MNKTAAIADKAQSLLDRIKETGSNALDTVKKNPEALAGIGGAAGGALISHMMQDPENRSIANYLMGAGAGAGLGALAAHTFKKDDTPETMLYNEPGNEGLVSRILGGTSSIAGKAASTIPAIGKGVLQAPGKAVQGVKEGLFGSEAPDISKGPQRVGPKKLGPVGGTLSAATAISLLALLATKGKVGAGIAGKSPKLAYLLKNLTPAGIAKGIASPIQTGANIAGVVGSGASNAGSKLLKALNTPIPTP